MVDNKEVMAKNIKYYMNREHLNSQDMCRIFGFKQATFSDWINAKAYPRIDKIERMANYFNISKAYLVEDWQTNLELSVHFANGERVLIETFRNLDDSHKEILMAYAKGLSEAIKNDNKRA